MRSYWGVIPNAHIRDFQRQRVYDAEEQCSFWQKGLESPPLQQNEIRALVIKIASWASIKQPAILYKSSYKIPTAYATANSLVLPVLEEVRNGRTYREVDYRRLPYVCHEMAHVINYNSDNADHHGKYFALTYLALVKKFISPTASTELRKAFRKKRVKYARV